MNMEFFFGIVFWIIAVSSCLPVSSPPKVKMSDWKFKLVRRDVKCNEKDSTFYAPENVKTSCITAALECVKMEFEGTVRAECHDNNGRINQFLDNLQHKINERKSKKSHESSPAQKNPSECACEVWPQTNFTTFMGKVEDLVQLENSLSAKAQ